MKKIMSTFPQYMGWVLKRYQDVKQRMDVAPYKLIEATQIKPGHYLLTIQVKSKAVTYTATPQEILAHDTWLEGFDKQDVRTITYLGCLNFLHKPNLIVSQTYDETQNKLVFGIKQQDGEILYKTAQAISMDQDLLKRLSPEEAHLIGYTAANELVGHEMAMIRELKKQAKGSNSS